jgi:hypothetical protein
MRNEGISIPTWSDLYGSSPTSWLITETKRLITDIIRTQTLQQREAFENEIMNRPVRKWHSVYEFENKKAHLSLLHNRCVNDDEVSRALLHDERIENLKEAIKNNCGRLVSNKEIESALRPKTHGSDAMDSKIYAMGRGCGKTPRWAEPEALEDPFPNAHRPKFTSGGFRSLEDSDGPDFGSWWSRPTTPRYFKPHLMQSGWLEALDNILSGYLNPKFLSISHLKNNKFDMKNFNCGDTVFFFVPMQAAPKVGSGVIKAKRTAETLDGKMEIEYDIDGTKLEDEKVFKSKEALLATL